MNQMINSADAIPTKIKFDESFFEEEERCNFYVTRKRKELWAILLDLWQEFDRVCRKYGLKYYLNGGTLLGAVRHKGFIPWDDDFDVMMFRKDYNKLLEIGANEFRHPYFFQHGYTDLYYYYAQHIKVRNSATLAEMYNWLHTKHNHGIFFDVFALDVLNEDEEKVREQEKELLMYQQLMDSLINQSKTYVPVTLNVGGKVRKFENVLHIHRLFEECAQRYENSPTKMVTEFVLYLKKDSRGTFPIEYLGEPIYVPFESFSAPIPSNSDAILKINFGDDYMTPKMSATSLHGDIFVDTRHSYLDIINNLRLV